MDLPAPHFMCYAMQTDYLCERGFCLSTVHLLSVRIPAFSREQAKFPELPGLNFPPQSRSQGTIWGSVVILPRDARKASAVLLS